VWCTSIQLVDCNVRPSAHFPTEGKLYRKESLSLFLYSRASSANSGVSVIEGKSDSSGTGVKLGMTETGQLGIAGNGAVQVGGKSGERDGIRVELVRILAVGQFAREGKDGYDFGECGFVMMEG
jgi:hypothetical protein